jgi:eukaryotic-like serine/threonine-protein kinase
MTERDIFLALLDIPDPAARSAFLAKACARDAALRERVENLLQSHDAAGSFLGKPALPPLTPTPLSLEERGGGKGRPDDGATQDLGADSLADKGAAADGNDFSFLAASTRPDSLGRLGHYEILEVLGRGGFGIVFRAFDESLRRVVAIKVLVPEMAATSPARKRFLREARASAKVQHDNIVQVFAVEEEPLPHLVMEFVPGETLQQLLDRNGPLEVPEVVRLGRQIAEGLGAAHDKGLIHRDVKPGNILIEAPSPPTPLPRGERGECGHVKIADFGLAQAADDASMSQSGIIAGTPMYMAPEQASADVLDHRADLFSLGSVLYTMCSGRPPFRASSTLAVLKRVAEDTPRPIREIIPEVPQWLCDLIARLHAKKPEDRIATAREVAELLERGLAGAVGHVSKVPADRACGKCPPRRWRWAVAAAAVLVLLGGLGITEATGVSDVRGTVIRLFSPEGTLVVKVDDPGVSVKIDGSDIVITGAGAKEIRLKPGRYVVEASKDGKLVSRELVAVTKDGRQVVRVSQEPITVTKADVEKQDFDRRAAYYVLSIGGAVRINDEDRNVGAVAELPQEPFRLTVVSFDMNKQVTDAGLAAFEGCTNVTYLSLYGCRQLTDAGLARFKDCKGLTYLELEHVSVTDASLAAFKNYKNLKHLHLGNTQVTDAGLAYLKDLKNLTQFQLLNQPVTDAGLAQLKDWKDLTFLDLRGVHVTDAGMAYFKDCKDLTTIWASGTSITDAGLAVFKDCKNLAELDLAGTSITDEGLAHLKGREKLTGLNVGGTAVTDAGLAHLAGLNGVTALSLGGTKVSDAGLAHLKGMPLRLLVIHDTGITDLTPLQGMTLEDIRLTPKNITKGLDMLRDMQSLKTIGIGNQAWPAAEFWERYGKGEFKE